jgi:ATP-binding cassette subfamily F protein uup
LIDFDGTLLLVSHDRTFLDNVVTSTLVFEGDGGVGEYVGGYEDWLRQRKPPLVDEKRSTVARRNDAKRRHSENRHSTHGKKLSYKEQRELNAIPGRIEALEQEQRQLTQQVSQAELYQQHRDTITATMDRLHQIHEELEQAYERWEYLDAREKSASVSDIKKS